MSVSKTLPAVQTAPPPRTPPQPAATAMLANFIPGAESLARLTAPALSLDRHLALLQLPPSPQYTNAQQSFASVNHKAFQHITHHLLIRLHTMPHCHRLVTVNEFLTLPSILQHCYPVYDSAQNREFVDTVTKILTFMQNFIPNTFAPNSVRKSYLQQPTGARIVGILNGLATFTARMALQHQYPNSHAVIPPLTNINTTSNSAEYRLMFGHLSLTGQELLATIAIRVNDRDKWQTITNELLDHYQSLDAEIKLCQSIESQLLQDSDRKIFTGERKVEREKELILIDSVENELIEWCDHSKETRSLLSDIAEGRWQPSSVSVNGSESDNGSAGGGSVDLIEILDEWSDHVASAIDSLATRADNSALLALNSDASQLHGDIEQLHQQFLQMNDIIQQQVHMKLQTRASIDKRREPMPIPTPAPGAVKRAGVASLDRPPNPFVSLSALVVDECDGFQSPVPSPLASPLEAVPVTHTSSSTVSVIQDASTAPMPALSVELTNEAGLLDSLVDDIDDDDW